MHAYTTLDLGPLAELRLQVRVHEGVTLLSLLADALGGRGHGVHPAWRELIRSSLPETAPAVLRPLFTRDYEVLPDVLTPTASMPDSTVATQVERLGDMDPAVLMAQLDAEFGGRIPPHWQSVARRPRQWVQAYAVLLRTVWDAFAPVWKEAAPLFSREIERVGVSTVQGLQEQVVQGLSGRFRTEQQRMLLPDPQGTEYELGDRPLHLVPVVSGPGASLFALDRSDLAWIGYPLPGLGTLWKSAGRGGAPDPCSTLALVLGSTRAQILLAASEWLSMGELAAQLSCSPANATHHCAALVEARLLERRRAGRQIRVRRSERGVKLLDLLR